MELNIEKLKSKLNSISNEVYYRVDKFYSDTYKDYCNVIEFNNLIQTYLVNNKDLKDNIDGLYYTTDCFGAKDFDDMRDTLNFIQSNEQAIKIAILESIEE